MTEKIIIHCSYTKPDMDIGVEEIRSWHKARGWADIGYQYVIRRNGEIEKGRDLDGDGDVDEEIGAHTLGHNKGSIGICLVGGKGRNRKVDSNFTFNQLVALHGLVVSLIEKHGPLTLHGHRDYANKECPCFDVHEFFVAL